MTVIREGNKAEGGHYFYQKFLRDIPITGSTKDSQVTLTEPGGSTFYLHFVGNGSEGGRPLDFENSIGMALGRALTELGATVSLRGTFILPRVGNGRRYSDVTSEGDTAFEGRVQAFFRSVLRGDKTLAARFISYPLNVNFPNRKRRKFRDSAEVLSAWNDIFTPAMITTLQRDLPHDMFVHNGMVMLGDGTPGSTPRDSQL